MNFEKEGEKYVSNWKEK